MAKWTGPTLPDIFEMAEVKPEATTVIFYTTDEPKGYTSLQYDYIMENDTMIALKLNDITLTERRGFPFQVVAEGKLGYKWAKWVTRIELSTKDFRGYWEQRGYSNSANYIGP
jgi:DMSO/TMAO reductase YedYZ molybdopterin-dependent catalytic subunit